MKVQLIAATQIDADALRGIGYEPHPYVVNDDNGEFGDYDHDELAEFAGRNCYRSFHRPNPATRENEDYLAHILEVGHESVLEHASATFYIETSRSVLTELERHRHLSFSVVSQRYVDPTELGVHVPPAIQECMGEIPGEILRDAVEYAVGSYEAIVSYLSGVRGLPRKQAREAARAVLPNMTNSPMVVTGNHRAWRYVIKARWHEAADAEIRELAGELLRQLREIAPNTYQDIPSEPYSYGG
ncbi:thymidylate synthase [Mycobacterium phage Jeffabunny]|uniref:ThyX-like thymidylate synthase n=2 Tax=Gladiatorvirus TaxID=2948726 RepID=V5R4H9_9CAUD|nr:thymidylate synthase [Mycobacterium phage Zaka]YP_009638222.1 thymidylate synthase [Mycobacterium phage Jeffabunny]ANT42239.1 ThyX-like thymidylate synthase [Mycobacterium phage ToneTone]ASZ74522.1 ThyX-like thymidylate synthase [Mycobacterium phage Wiks]ATW59742.1 ThyX-like thymidylate synthase [Mycobacterium phage WunderPhul]QGZ13560.1 ThyX-like thymidylate synthase [Mycobacterium phage Yokurt]QWT29729.1 ThyX-like thymidylate synthase [Mycobacterium phage Indra]